MTELLAALALAVSDSFVLSLTLKATLILVVALACAHGVPRARASRRFLVVAWAFVIVGSLPVIALIGRPLTVVVRDAPVALPMPAAPIRAVMPDGNPPLTDARDGPLRSVLSSQPDMGLTWTELVAIVWAVGFLVSILPIGGALLRLRRLRRAAGPCIDTEECRERWPDLVEMMGVSRWPEVRLLDAALVPITFGMRRPVILLPADIRTWRSIEERFKLSVRWELRERPQYVLSFTELVNPQSPLLQPRFDCGDAVGPAADGVPSTAGSAAERRCGPVRVTLTPTGGHMLGAGIAMARLVEMLERVVRAEVIDGTGFTERFDLDLQFGEPPHASTLEAALRESLGLQLDRREVPGEVLVVEHVDMPVLD